jgi:hypothetical protein
MRGEHRSTWQTKWFTPDSFDRIAHFVSNSLDLNIYFAPRGFRAPRRLARYAAPAPLLAQELDRVHPRDLDPRPSIAWETSPGKYQAIWFTDGPAPIELNRALCYAIGADHGTHDAARVVRVPNTRNYKHRFGRDGVPGRVLWSEPRRYRIPDLLRGFPPRKEVPGSAHREPDMPAESRAKLLDRLPWHVRRELELPEVPRFMHRSQHLWKTLYPALAKAGMSAEETITLIGPTVWNKFAERTGGHTLQVDVEKWFSTH